MKKIRSIVIFLLTPGLLLGLYWPVIFISTHIPHPRNFGIHASDKVLHFTAYFLLGLLFWLAFYRKARPSLRDKRFYLTLFTLTAYGVLDEISQKLVGRDCSGLDLLSDFGGVLTALIVLSIFRRVWHWLILYGLLFFTMTHWPTSTPVITLPDFWKQFNLVYLMIGYIVLTLLWWRSFCPDGKFIFNKYILAITLFVIPFYALLDQLVDVLMGQGFQLEELVISFAGIFLAIMSSAALSRHHLVDKPYGEK
ncbi:MAG: VanZ family protein [Phycisphaerae bacterium]|nr:VanZ family protein [Phycisphaerae bacterium]